MGWLIFILICVIFLVAIMLSQPNNTPNPQGTLSDQLHTDPVMFSNLFAQRNRVIEESLEIISKTNDLKTLETRYWDALDSVNWIKEQVKNGAPVKFHEEPCGFEHSLNRMFNENLERIASNDKATERLRRKCVEMLKPHDNYEPTKFFIETILIDGAKLRRHNEEAGAILGKVAASNNEGIAYEESGDIEGAIQAYEQNVTLGYPATHSYIRLMKIYRRRRDYQNELRIIERYLEVFTVENERRAVSAMNARPEYSEEIQLALETNEQVRDDRYNVVFHQYDVMEVITRADKVRKLIAGKPKRD